MWFAATEEFVSGKRVLSSLTQTRHFRTLCESCAHSAWYRKWWNMPKGHYRPNHDGISRTVGGFCTSNYPAIYRFFGCFGHFRCLKLQIGNIPQARGFMKTVRAWGSLQFPSDCRAEPRDPRRRIGFHHYVCRECENPQKLMLTCCLKNLEFTTNEETSPRCRMCMDVNSVCRHTNCHPTDQVLYTEHHETFAVGAHQPCTSIQYVWCLVLAISSRVYYNYKVPQCL